VVSLFLSLLMLRPASSTLFPYTTLFRSSPGKLSGSFRLLSLLLVSLGGHVKLGQPHPVIGESLPQTMDMHLQGFTHAGVLGLHLDGGLVLMDLDLQLHRSQLGGV